jgi:sigma-E factor negative regulatory protein RseC
MATEEGVVIKLNGGNALVTTTKTSACKGCAAKSSCNAMGGGKEMRVEAINSIGAKVGQNVVISFETTPLLKATFMLYMFPIIVLLTGAFTGQKLGLVFNVNPSLCSAFVGFFFFGIAILWVRIQGNKMAKKEEYQPRIIRIM